MNRVVASAIRALMGLFFIIAELDGFFNFLPPFPMSDKAVAFTDALIDSRFLWQLMRGTQIAAGILLLIDWYVPLALTLLAPIITIIFCMHLFINPSGLPNGIVLAGLELALA
jgi:hypothetical protein